MMMVTLENILGLEVKIGMRGAVIGKRIRRIRENVEC